MRKIIAVLGILAALFVVEGLLRFGSFVGVIGSALEESNYHAFYMAFSIVYVVISGVLLVSLFREFSGKGVRILKYTLLIVGIGCLGLMLAAPALPVIGQIIGGMTLSLFALFFIKVHRRENRLKPENASHAAPSISTEAEPVYVPKRSSGLFRFLKIGLSLVASGFVFVLVNVDNEGGVPASLGEVATTLVADALSDTSVYTPTYEIRDVIDLEPILVRIDKVQTSRVIGSELWASRANSGAIYLIVEYSFKNNSNKQISPFDAPDLIVRDVNKNWFASSPDPTVLVKAHRLANSLSSQGLYTGDPINPGITYQDILVFELNEDSLQSAGWRLFPAVGDKEAPVRFMKEPENLGYRPEYFGTISYDTHAPSEAADLAAKLYSESIFLGANCCEVTGNRLVEASGNLSCPTRVPSLYFEYESSTYAKGESVGEGNTYKHRFGICVLPSFDSLADLIFVTEESNGDHAQDLSSQLEEAYVYYAGWS